MHLRHTHTHTHTRTRTCRHAGVRLFSSLLFISSYLVSWSRGYIFVLIFLDVGNWLAAWLAVVWRVGKAVVCQHGHLWCLTSSAVCPSKLVLVAARSLARYTVSRDSRWLGASCVSHVVTYSSTMTSFHRQTWHVHCRLIVAIASPARLPGSGTSGNFSSKCPQCLYSDDNFTRN